MKQIPFTKYTAYGNNFVIVDETDKLLLPESEKSSFAYYATNPCFGVGSDNLLIIQRCRLDTLASINRIRDYWDNIPDVTRAQFIFRMFEPNGEEAFCCGNGLLCISDYLRHRYGIASAQIMVEIPLSVPEVMSIGKNPNDLSSSVIIGNPERLPTRMLKQSVTAPYGDRLDLIRDIKIPFRSYDLAPFSNATSLFLSGYLVFTGEPHLVIFPEAGFSLPQLAKMIFTSPIPKPGDSEGIDKRASFGSWLIHHIGSYINKYYPDLFPMGININFVNITQDHILEYRCFERGINRETLACGTGAVASCFVAHDLQLVTTKAITVLPFRCRWYDPQATIYVKEGDNGWILSGTPNRLFEGTFNFEASQRHGMLEQLPSIDSIRHPNQQTNVVAFQDRSEQRPSVSGVSKATSGASEIHYQILLVEVDPMQVKLMQVHLMQPNYTVHVANNGQEALAFAQEETIDLIILDIMLPGMDGYEVCRRFKTSDKTCSIPIIFTTSLNDRESRITGIEAESDDFLVKPIDAQELRAKIQVLLKQKKYIDQLRCNYEMSMTSAIHEGGYLHFKDP